MWSTMHSFISWAHLYRHTFTSYAFNLISSLYSFFLSSFKRCHLILTYSAHHKILSSWSVATCKETCLFVRFALQNQWRAILAFHSFCVFFFFYFWIFNIFFRSQLFHFSSCTSCIYLALIYMQSQVVLQTNVLLSTTKFSTSHISHLVNFAYYATHTQVYTTRRLSFAFNVENAYIIFIAMRSVMGNV